MPADNPPIIQAAFFSKKIKQKFKTQNAIKVFSPAVCSFERRENAIFYPIKCA
jgi:hypothetical protein